MEHGNIAQQGTHAELYKQQDGIYFQLMRNQLQHAEHDQAGVLEQAVR